MNIINLKDEIIRHSLDDSDCIALWLRSGFNWRFCVWFYDIKETFLNLSLQDGYTGRWKGKLDYPWNQDTNACLKTNEPNHRLQYIYIFSNKGCPKGCKSIEELRDHMVKALDFAESMELESLSMIYIPCLDMSNGDAAIEMIETARSWSESSPRSLKNLYLVDKIDGFDHYVNPRPEKKVTEVNKKTNQERGSRKWGSKTNSSDDSRGLDNKRIFYDLDGDAVAYLLRNQGRIYLTDGIHCADLKEDGKIHGVNGKKLGYYEECIVFDLEGCRVGYSHYGDFDFEDFEAFGFTDEFKSMKASSFIEVELPVDRDPEHEESAYTLRGLMILGL